MLIYTTHKYDFNVLAFDCIKIILKYIFLNEI